MASPALPLLAVLWLSVAAALAQTPCEGTPAYSPCEIPFDLPTAPPNPLTTVQLRIEFRSPRFKTYLMPAFWDGTRQKMVVRFTPTEAGQWTYKISSNIPAFDGKEGMFNAGPSDSPGFVNVANVHHWATDNKKAHLWMGFIADRFAFLSAAEFDQQLNQAAQNKFTHFRGSILGNAQDRALVYLGPDRPNPAFFEELDRRVAEIHK